MIQMKSGVYGGKNKLIRPEDGPFRLTPEEEARLVKRGVAKYVSETGETLAEGKTLDNMSAAELRVMGKELGLPPFRVGMTKVAMAEAIRAKQAELPVDEDDDNDPPVDPADLDNEDDGEDNFDEDEDEDDDVDDPPPINPAEAMQ